MGSVGQFIGQMSITFISNRFGRKVAMWTFWAAIALSVMVECLAKDWKVWLVAKILGGLGVGGMQATIPLYIAEVAPINARGAFLTCYSLWWVTGMFFAPVALQVMSKNDPTNWKTPVYTQWGQIGLMGLIYLILPESPAWCATRGDMERTKKAIRPFFRGIENVDIDHQVNLLSINVEHERSVAIDQRSEKWYAIFRGTDRKRTIISLWTMMTQQFIGLQIFFGYGTYFFQQAGIEDPFMVTCITNGINIAWSIIILYLADAVGRRKMACYGTTLCWFCVVAVGILGVVPKGKATNILLVMFSVFWSTY